MKYGFERVALHKNLDAKRRQLRKSCLGKRDLKLTN